MELSDLFPKMSEFGLELDLKMVRASEKLPTAVLGELSHSFSEHILLIAAL